MQRLAGAPALALPDSASGGSIWQVEAVDAPKYLANLRDRSLALDSAGHAHIAFGGDHLYYASHDGTAWHVEMADSSPAVGRYASLELDTGGHPHISYITGDLPHLINYAYYGGTAWHIQTVAEGTDDTSLALDSSGLPHITYVDTVQLYYAHYDGVLWHVKHVDGGYRSAMALDAGGRPHISYFSGEGLNYAYFDGSDWLIETVDSESAAGLTGTSIALDSQGQPRIAYGILPGGPGLGRFASYDGSSWQIETLGSEFYYAPSLALDSDDLPHITGSGYDLTYYTDVVSYAHYTGAAWQAEILETVASAFDESSLALDAQGRIHTVYLLEDSDTLRYAVRDGGYWSRETVEAGGNVGEYNSLALDGAGQPHIGYTDDEELKYAYFDGSAWQVETVDSGLLSSVQPSLALDLDGHPTISYRSNAYLYYTRFDGESWHREQVAGPSGLSSDLTLDESGRPHISSCDIYGNVLYAYRDDLGWHLELVDAQPDTDCAETSLALDSVGLPHIAYSDRHARELRYARYDGYAWHIEVVSTTCDYCRGSLLALDSGDLPHLVYTTGDELRHVQFDGQYWHTTTVDSSAYGTGAMASLALDSHDYPHIAYSYNNSTWDRTLKHARCDGGVWQTEEVWTGSPGCGEIALVLDLAGQIHISFYDALNRDLMYAHGEPPIGDETPPTTITDLVASSGDDVGEIDLSWTAPGDDGDQGTATVYVVRYAEALIVSEFGWLMATDVDGEPVPQPAGSPESMTVSGLTPGQVYYFAIKTQDEVPNTSGLSNSPSAIAAYGGPTYSISGRVLKNFGLGLEGVTVSVGPGGSDTTDADGAYSIIRLPASTYTVTPSKDFYTFDPAHLTVTLPPDAQGQDFTALSPDTLFRPAPDGYGFDNYTGNYPDPPSASDFTEPDVRRMFGDGCVCIGGPVCQLQPAVRVWLDRVNTASNAAHCFGMAAASLRFFAGLDEHPGYSRTYDLGQNDSILAWWGGSSYSTTVRRHIAVYHVLQWTYPLYRELNESSLGTPNDVLRDLAQQMSSAPLDPPTLSFERERGKGGHSVTPYQIKDNGHGQFWVMVYDSNWHGDAERKVIFDTVANTWSYDMGSEMWSGNAASHTIFAAKLSQYDDPFCGEWDLPHRTLEGSAIARLWLIGGGHLLNVDSHGRRIGFVGDQLVSEVPGAYASPVLAGPGARLEPVYTLPLTETYTILLDGQTLTQTQSVDVTQFGPGYAVWAEGVPLEPASQDHLVIAADGTSLGYSAGLGKETTLALALDGPSQSYELRAIGADIGTGQVVTLTADVAQRRLAYSNALASGGSYDLEITRVGVEGERVFLHTGVAILATDTHYADYGAWDGSGPIILEIDHGSDGTIDETVQLENQAHRLYLPLVLRDHQ